MATLSYDAAVGYDDPIWTYDGAMVAPASPAGSVNGAIVSALQAVPGILAGLESVFQSVLRPVPGVLGVTWYYRRLTSGPANQTRSYGMTTSFVVHVSNRRTREEYNERGQLSARIEEAQVRTSDVLADLHQGDQVIDADGNFWSVSGMASSGYGTKAFAISRRIPLKASPERGGNV